MGKFKDLTGLKFNKLTVLKRMDERGSNNAISWLCMCECGNVTQSISASLKNNAKKSCGCLQKEKVREMNKNKKKDMTGLKVGRLTVIEEADERTSHGNIKWICRCECGNKTIVSQAHLTSSGKRIRNCGCYTKEVVSEIGKMYGGRNFEDLTGKEFGWLRVIERVLSIKKTPTYICICLLCGNKKTAKGKLLKNGHVSSCGCIKSVKEQIISDFLEEENVSFKTQYRFNDCRRINPLPFDFAILDSEDKISFLIEFDGIHHFIEQPNFGKLKYIQENDEIKNNYCISNNISLLRISYLEKNIDIENIIKKKMGEF